MSDGPQIVPLFATPIVLVDALDFKPRPRWPLAEVAA